MPNDSTPRSFAALIAMPPGRLAPTVANGAFRPARAFGAPQTICTMPLPVSTWQTCRRSASGCFSALTICATTTPSSDSPSTVMSSTSRPIAVSVAASSSRVAVVGTCWRSQFSENFMCSLPVGWASAHRHRVEWRVAAHLTNAGSGELLEEAHVVLEEAAQIVDAVTQHREALHAHAEGIAGVFLRIDADVAKHVRMDHAAAQHLEPARGSVRLLPGDIDFGGGLSEGEIAGTEAHFEIALEECAYEFGQRALEVGEARALVDEQAFALVEHWRVGLVAIAAVDLAERDHAQRRLVSEHVAHLHARGVRAQQATIPEVEGVVHRTRRMVRREVQRLEVVPVILDFRAIAQLEAEAAEDVGDALDRAADRMQAAAAGVEAGQRDVNGFRGEACIEHGIFQLDLALAQCRGEHVARLVDRLAGGLALFRRKRAELLELGGDAAALAQQGDAQRFDRIGRFRRGDVAQCLLRQRFDSTHSNLELEVVIPANAGIQLLLYLTTIRPFARSSKQKRKLDPGVRRDDGKNNSSKTKHGEGLAPFPMRVLRCAIPAATTGCGIDQLTLRVRSSPSLPAPQNPSRRARRCPPAPCGPG